MRGSICLLTIPQRATSAFMSMCMRMRGFPLHLCCRTVVWPHQGARKDKQPRTTMLACCMHSTAHAPYCQPTYRPRYILQLRHHP